MGTGSKRGQGKGGRRDQGVRTHPGESREGPARVEALLAVKGVRSAEGVTGPPDIVALAEARSLDDLNRRVIGSLQAIEEVIRTLPCTVV